MAATTMIVREIGNKRIRVAFGMVWSTLSGVVSESEEIRELAKENKVEFYARSTKGHSDDSLIGLPIGLDAAELKGKVYSAAQAFASMSGVDEHSMMVWKFDDDHVWVCRIRNGLPMVGKDLVLSMNEVEAFISEEHSFSDETITIYGNVQGDVKLNIEDIAFACGKDDEIRRVPGFKLTIGNIVLLVVVAGVAGGGYVYYQAQKAEAERARLAAMQQQASPDDQYLAAIKAAKPGTSVSIRWAEIQEAINSIQVDAGGWSLDRVECDVEAANVCTITWKRDIGSNMDLLSQIELPDNTQWSIDANKLTYQVKLPEAEPAKAFVLETSPSAREFLKRFVSQIQDASLVNLNISLKNGMPYGMPAGITLGDVSPELLISSGEWEMRGDVWMAEYATNLPPNMVLKSFSMIAESADIKFSMKGNYYAKK